MEGEPAAFEVAGTRLGHKAHLGAAIDDLLAGRRVRRQETPSFGCPIESAYYRA